ncbi:MAG: glycerophosphodiester phosphodiesterase [Bacteroidetes bacterium]|nr:MAG: glycerophosphodiester phosphodiesterase [Bacteroidota bacterium]
MEYTWILAPVLLLGSVAHAQETAGNRPFLFIAHRGASYLAPENTLASINLAWELGADAAECDVMLTSDDRVIVFHDKNTGRLTEKNDVVSETPWKDLSELTVRPRETNLPDYGSERIPLLEEVLKTIPEGRMLVIEIKTGTEILPWLKMDVDRYWKSGSIAFIAFDLETIRQAKLIFPEVPCYYLSTFRKDLRKHFDAIVDSGLDGVDLRHGMIDRRLVGKCNEAGLDVWCWTVNDPATARELKDIGVTAVTTDRPDWLRQNL